MKRKPKNPPKGRTSVHPKRHARGRPKSPSLGSAIKEARTKRGLTQLALANAIGLQGDDAGACVSRWEEGVYTPTFKNLSLIAEALGVGVGSLLPEAGKL